LPPTRKPPWIFCCAIKPGIDAHTHDFIRTGQIDSKFGFALETGEALQAVKRHSLSTGHLVGIHCHIGSQIFDIDPFELAACVMLEFIAEVKPKRASNLPS
jgi:diaminopimelate decarboxylase